MPHAQGGTSRQQASAYEQQQPVYTSMAGEDGSLVMLEPLFTDADEVLPPKQQEVFVLLNGIPQVSSLAHLQEASVFEFLPSLQRTADVADSMIGYRRKHMEE